MRTIVLCGDSTVSIFPEHMQPTTGWGAMLQSCLSSQARVINLAIGGRSSKSFVSEGRLTRAEAELSPGDLLLVQFGHNDDIDYIWRHTDADVSFAHMLRLYVHAARERGAMPVLCSPICRLLWDDDHKTLLPSLHDYPSAVRRVAADTHTPFIDLYARTRETVLALGYEESKKLYMFLEPGESPNYPNGSRDTTHTRREGGARYAAIVAEELFRLGLLHSDELAEGVRV